jgi:hypothetical protein
VGGGDEVEVFLVGVFVLVAEAAVAEVGTAEVSADAAGIGEVERIGIIRHGKMIRRGMERHGARSLYRSGNKLP